MSGGPSELPESVRRQRRTGSTSDSSDDSDDDTTTTSSVDDLPDDINQSRRSASGSDDTTSSGRAPSGGLPEELPDDPNAGRRATNDGGGSTQNPDETLPGEGETGLGDDPGGPEAAKKQAVGSQLEKEFIRNNNDITSRDQVDVENVRQTEDGTYTGDVVLTEEGQEAVAENQRAAVERMGTTGRRFLQREAEVNQEQAEAALAEDVQTNQFAREQLAEQIADETERTASDLDIQVDNGSLDIGLTEGGESRAIIEQAAENTEFSEEQLRTTVDESGETQIELTDEALVERAAEQSEEFSASDLQVEEREFEGASERRPGGTERVIRLTDEARGEELLEQAREENPDGNFTLVEGEDGPRVTTEERFDDDGRFFGIGGAEDEAEAVADVSTEFLSGVGQGAGRTLGAPVDIASSAIGLTESGDIAEFTGTLGEGGAQLANVPAALVTADEAGEFLGAAGAAGVNSALEGSTDPLAEFGEEGIAAGSFLGGQAAESAVENPVRTTGLVAGSAVTATGALRLAGGSGTTSGQLTRAIVQPGEEAFAAATGVRAGTAAARAASRVRSSIPDVNVRSFSRSNRGQFDLDTGGASQKQIELTGRETASDFDKPVSELEVSEGTRRQILENTARQAESDRSVFTQEADMELSPTELRALREMPPAQAFQNPGQFAKSFQRRIERAETETEGRTGVRDNVSTARSQPVRTVLSVGQLTATAAAQSPNMVEGVEATATQPRLFRSDVAAAASVSQDAQAGLSAAETAATGVESTAATAEELDVPTTTATQQDAAVELTTDTATQSEIESVVESTTDTTTETTTDLTAETATETRVDTTTEVALETSRDVQRETELPSLNSDSPDRDDRRDRFGEFERVFESNVASAEEVLGVEDES